MAKAVATPSAGMFPNPVVLVTCGHGAEANIITLAWAGTVCGNPRMLSISMRPATHSHGLLKKHWEFVLNVPTTAMMEAVHICGSKSGRDVDKWALAGLHRDASNSIQTPGIAECPVSLECKVKHILDLGLHTMFVAEIVGERRDPDWQMDPPPPLYVRGKYYAMGTEPFDTQR